MVEYLNEDVRFLIGVFSGSILTNIGSYMLLRSMLWSIVWCDIGGKYRKIRKLKSGVKFYDRIRMKYLKEHTKDFSRNFEFWFSVKNIVEIVLIIFSVSIVLGFIFYPFICAILVFIYNTYCIILFIVIASRFDVHKNTKYDRIRLGKNKK